MGNLKKNQDMVEKQESTPAENTNSSQQEGPRAGLLQYLIASCAHLGALNMAMAWSWSSTALPSLRESSDTLGSISETGEAWIGSIAHLASALGSTVSGPIMQKLGLRKSLIIGCVPLMLGWLLIVWAPSIWAILLGRFITGFSVSGVSASTTLMGELAHDTRRGKINLGFDLSFCVGALVVYVVGSFVGWQAQALVCAAASLINLVLLITVVVESPQFLLAQGNEAQAINNLKFVRNSENIDVEFNEIRRDVRILQGKAETARNGQWFNGLTENFLSMEIMKPIIIATFLQFFLQASGVAPITGYAVDVFKAAGTEGVHENVSTIVLGVVNLVATAVALVFVDKQGRRRMFIFSEIILFLTLLFLGIFLMFEGSFGEHPIFDWIPLVCFVIYITGYSFGVGPIPWVLMGEIFSPNAKGFSQATVTCIARVIGFLVMFFFNDMNKLIGQHWVYLVFATFCFCGVFFAYLFVPETNGKSQAKIQEEMRNSWFHHRCGNCNGNGEDPQVCGQELKSQSHYNRKSLHV